MKNITKALLALPLVLAANSFGGDIFSEGDKALGNTPKVKPALVERFDPETGERVLFNADALKGKVSSAKVEGSQEEFRTLLADKENLLDGKELAVTNSKPSLKDAPTTAWCGARYYRPIYYSYYSWYVPTYYYYYTWTYTVYTYTYYNRYYWTWYY